MKNKYIKYSTILLLISILIKPIITIASDDCKIKSSPAPTLLEYLNNVDAVVSNINSSTSSATANNSLWSSALNYVVWSLWKIVSLWDIMSWFDFYISLPLTNEVPDEILRDHTRLMEKTEELIDLYKTTVENWYWGVVISNACSWVSNCELEWTARQIFSKIIENNNKIIKYYRYIILDKRYILDSDVQLVPNDFSTEMWKYYNKETLTECSRYEWWFFQEIMDKITSIWEMFSTSYEWYDDWKEAFNLLKWIDSDNDESEKEILENYLDSIWMNKKNSDTLIDNLEKYNLWWLSASDPITNSVNYSFNEVKETVDTFTKALNQQFRKDWWSEKIAIKKITEALPKVKSTYDIKHKILNLYKTQIYYAIPQDTNTENLELALIKMHYWLVDSIKILAETVRFSEKVCNQQCSWWGKCSFKQ